ncbi:LysM domain/BON superfamily protein [Polystyrenella longa]|uniref:LysM domain/BON superfamily protein n=1 Tax=Polystyrenella longa TaxID=2528007 RepID=A0A518CNT7_9PLAN|nr:LysM peptidoglycan-binding domain-containing protein [Polystyrenella longa]QDU80854.1 LysM domain/BON superfamily protein [Polystyrenella longa]
MKTETKFGLLTIVILLGVFGYVVFDKWETRKAIIAAGGDPDAVEGEVAEGENPGDPFLDEGQTPVVNVNNEVESTETSSDLFSEANSNSSPADNKLPANTFAANEEPFSPDAEPAFSEANSNESDFGNEFGDQFSDADPFPEAQEGSPQESAQPNAFAEDNTFSEPNSFSEPNAFAEDNSFGEDNTFSEPDAFAQENSVPKEDAFADQDSFGTGLSEEPPVNVGQSSNFEPFSETTDQGSIDSNVASNNASPVKDPFPSDQQPSEEPFAEPAEDLNAFNDTPSDFSDPAPEANVVDAFAPEESPFGGAEQEPAVKDAFANTSNDIPVQETPEFNLEENELFEETSTPSEFSQNQTEPGVMNEAPFDEEAEFADPPFEQEAGSDFADNNAPVQDAFGLEEPKELNLSTEINTAPFQDPQPSTLASEPRAKRPDPFAQSAEEYKVQAGDNLWRIANNIYGSGTYATALAQYNHQTLPDASKLKPGMILKTPAVKELERYQPGSQQNISLMEGGGTAKDPFAQKSGFFVNEETGEPFYKVQSNDTLTAISYRHLGRASRWIQIVALNKNEIKDPKSLKPGTVLRLPADARTVVLTSDSFESDRN